MLADSIHPHLIVLSIIDKIIKRNTFVFFDISKPLHVFFNYFNRAPYSQNSTFIPKRPSYRATGPRPVGKPKRRRIAERAECEINWNQPARRAASPRRTRRVILIRIRELVPGQCSVSSVRVASDGQRGTARLVPGQMSPWA